MVRVSSQSANKISLSKAPRIQQLPVILLLGHGSLRTIMRYVHIGQEHQKAAMLAIEQAMTAEQGRTQ